MVQVLESGIMDGFEPLFALENIDQYIGWVRFPEPGTDGLIATHSHSERIHVLTSAIISTLNQTFQWRSTINEGLFTKK